MKRARPAELVPGTLRVLSFSLNYLPDSIGDDWIERSWKALEQPEQAVGFPLCAWSRLSQGGAQPSAAPGRADRTARRPFWLSGLHRLSAGA